MKLYKISILLLFIFIFTINSAVAEDFNITDIDLDDTNTVYVNASYTGTIEEGTQSHPYKSIYTGVNSISRQSKSNLYIANGEYQITRALSLRNKNLTIIGESTNTVLNARGLSTIMQLYQGNYTIYNIKFINGNGLYSGSKSNGGAILFNTTLSNYQRTSINTNSLKIFNCIFENNNAYNGGAIAGGNGYVAIYNSLFRNNNGTNGGGIYLDNTNSTLDNLNLYSNTASDGGAIYTRASYLTITNSKILNNNGTNGGGAYLSYGIISISQSEFNNNIANGTNANGGGLYIYEASGNIINTHINNNKVSGDVISSSAIFNVNTQGLTITNSYIQDNTLDGNYGFGSIISNKGTLTITNSIITGNTMEVSNNLSDLIYNPNGRLNLNNNQINNNNSLGEEILIMYT